MDRTCHCPTLYLAPFKGRASTRVLPNAFLCVTRAYVQTKGRERGEKFVALTCLVQSQHARPPVLLMERVYGTCITGAKVAGRTSFTSSSSLRAICCKAARECNYISRFGPEPLSGPPCERPIAHSVFLSLSLSLSLSLLLNQQRSPMRCLYISVCTRM